MTKDFDTIQEEAKAVLEAAGYDNDYDNMTAKTLADLANSEYVLVRHVVAQHRNTSSATLALLSIDDNNSIQFLVAANPNTPVKLIARFAEGRAAFREAVAQNPKAPAEILAVLAKDRVVHVRRKVAMNPNTPDSTIDQLVNDKETGPFSVSQYARNVQAARRARNNHAV